jgi:hypothetical protein
MICTNMNNTRFLILIVLFFIIKISSASAQKPQVNEKEYQHLLTQYDSLLPTWITQFENDITAFEKQDSAIGNI